MLSDQHRFRVDGQTAFIAVFGLGLVVGVVAEIVSSIAILVENREILALQLEYPFIYPYVQDVSELLSERPVLPRVSLQEDTGFE
ncbi:MAG TPA: hypothetical protein VIV14_05440 [Gammaproteobacteria bacterium]